MWLSSCFSPLNEIVSAKRRGRPDVIEAPEMRPDLTESSEIDHTPAPRPSPPRDQGHQKNGYVRVSWDDRLFALSRLQREHGEVVLFGDGVSERNWTGPGRGGYNLGAWVCRQRVRRAKGSLSKREMDELTEAGMPWTSATRPSSSRALNSPIDAAANESDMQESEEHELEHDVSCECLSCTDLNSFTTLKEASGLLWFMNSFFKARLEAKRRGDQTFNRHNWYCDFTRKIASKTNPRKRTRREDTVISLPSFYRFINEMDARGKAVMTFADLPIPGRPPVLGQLEEALYEEVVKANINSVPFSVRQLRKRGPSPRGEA